MLSCVPLRTSIVPKNIRIDTATLFDLLRTEETEASIGNINYVNNNIIKLKDVIWQTFFKTDLHCFGGSSRNRGGSKASKKRRRKNRKKRQQAKKKRRAARVFAREQQLQENVLQEQNQEIIPFGRMRHHKGIPVENGNRQRNVLSERKGPKFVFDGMIMTDGISCSIVFKEQVPGQASNQVPNDDVSQESAQPGKKRKCGVSKSYPEKRPRIAK
jgi:hypothetical protein